MASMSSEEKRAFYEITHCAHNLGTNVPFDPKNIRGAAVLKTKIPEYLSFFASKNLYKAEDKGHFSLTKKGEHEFLVMMNRESIRGRRVAY